VPRRIGAEPSCRCRRLRCWPFPWRYYRAEYYSLSLPCFLAVPSPSKVLLTFSKGCGWQLSKGTWEEAGQGWFVSREEWRVTRGGRDHPPRIVWVLARDSLVWFHRGAGDTETVRSEVARGEWGRLADTQTRLLVNRHRRVNTEHWAVRVRGQRRDGFSGSLQAPDTYPCINCLQEPCYAVSLRTGNAGQTATAILAILHLSETWDGAIESREQRVSRAMRPPVGHHQGEATACRAESQHVHHQWKKRVEAMHWLKRRRMINSVWFSRQTKWGPMKWPSANRHPQFHPPLVLSAAACRDKNHSTATTHSRQQ
jgi:hypothetical protein